MQDDTLLGGTVPGNPQDGAPVEEFTFIDLSPFIETVDAELNWNEIIPAGLVPMEPITITGTWYPTPPFEPIVSAVFRGVRLPRKSKKALRKAWLGSRLSEVERRRLSRLTLTATGPSTPSDRQGQVRFPATEDR